MHICVRWLIKTENKMITESGKSYNVYICEDCKRYYIRKGKGIFEVQYNYNENLWKQVA